MRGSIAAFAAAAASRAAKAAPSSKSSAVKKSSSSSSSSKPSASSSKRSPSSPVVKSPSPTSPKAAPPNRMCSLSPSLAKLLDINETTRPDALKRVWAYIKTQKLQNQLDKKEILCDEKLKVVLGRDKVTITEVVKYLSPHISKKD